MENKIFIVNNHNLKYTISDLFNNLNKDNILLENGELKINIKILIGGIDSSIIFKINNLQIDEPIRLIYTSNILTILMLKFPYMLILTK